MARIGLIDYRVGNLGSVRNAFEFLGHEVDTVVDPAALDAVSHIVLPGVGAFGPAAKSLATRELDVAIVAEACKGKPILGICLGLQLLAGTSEEYGSTKGLGLIDAAVVRLVPGNGDIWVPHVGWNNVLLSPGGRLCDGLPDSMHFYFNHSYVFLDPHADHVIGTFRYGGPQVAVVERDNVFGLQFHPEKSQMNGLRVLRNFVSAS